MVLSAKINVIFKLSAFKGFFFKYIFFKPLFAPFLWKKDIFAGEFTPIGFVYTLYRGEYVCTVAN